MEVMWSGGGALVWCGALAGAALAWRMRMRVRHARRAVRFRALPTEIKARILAHLVLATLERGTPISTYLLCSRWHYQYLVPIAYGSIALRSAAALRSLRVTLALHRPSIGLYVRQLRLVNCGDAPALGLEQVLLAVPLLEHLALDGGGMARLCASGIGRTACGAHPRSLTLELGDGQALARSIRTLLALRMFARTETLCVTAPLELACAAIHCAARMPCVAQVGVEVVDAPLSAMLLQHAVAALKDTRAVNVALSGYAVRSATPR